MTTRNALVAILITLGVVAGASWAQIRKERSPIRIPAEAQFVVTMSGDTAIMVESKQGTTWRLVTTHDGGVRSGVWVPLDRIDDHVVADQFLKQLVDEQKRRMDEQRRVDEERRTEEQEKRRLEEQRRLQEQQKRRIEELRRLEEQQKQQANEEPPKPTAER